jgi:hypothetical protein
MPVKRQIPQTSLSEAEKKQVCDLIAKMPGLKSREIALRTALNKTELNRFLWGEGKDSRGLYERNWRWHHSGVETGSLFSSYPSCPSKKELPSTPMSGAQEISARSICAILTSISEIEAIRQIRRLDSLAVDKAFSEEDYAVLPEVLQIELIRRHEELKTYSPLPQSYGTSRSLPLAASIPLAIAAIAIAIKLINTFTK